MNIGQLKQVRYYLLGSGFGFAASAFVGLDGIRESISLPQLLIGTGLLAITEILYLIIFYSKR